MRAGIAIVIGAALSSACGRIGFDDQASALVTPVYPDHAEWLSFVRNRNGGTSIYDQPDRDCTGDEAGTFDACIHAGALRKVSVEGLESCAGLMALDELDAFGWTCDDTGGVARFLSTGLKADRGLADLIEPSGKLWKRERVVISNDSGVIAQSAEEVWWGNAVVPLEPGAGVVALDRAGTVYTAPSTVVTDGFNVQADHVAVVTLADARIELAATAPNGCNLYTGRPEPPPPPDDTNLYFYRPCAIGTGDRRFLWFEGTFDNDPDRPATDDFNTAIISVRGKQITLRHVRIQNGGYGVLLSSTTASVIHDLRVMNVSKYGLLLDPSYADQTGPSSDNVISGLVGGNTSGTTNGSTVILVDGGASRNVLTQIQATNVGGTCLLMFDGGNNDNIWSHVTATNCAAGGLQVVNATNGNQNLTIVQGAFGNSVEDGVGVANTPGTRLAQIVSAHHGFSGIALTGTSVGASLVDNFQLGNNAGGDCTGCPTTVQLTTGITLAGAFAGRVGAEASNPASAGTADQATIADWLAFDSPYRAWGIEAAAFPDPASTGRCATGPCRIWDWRPRIGSVLVEHSDTPQKPNAPFVAGAACPGAVDGDRAISDVGGRTTFLINAVELMFDGVGNDNGLCESGESCVYSPNIGAYQGEGDLVGPCTFIDGKVSSVTMFARARNGT